MTIDEAILRIENMIDSDEDDFGKENLMAMKLSAEALKRVKKYRDPKFPIQGELLPGETEE
jgi:hypothetical protein